MNRNPQTVQNLIEGQRLNPAVDLIPNPIPTIESNPKLVNDGFGRLTSATSTGTLSLSAATLGTVTGDLLLTEVNISLVKNVTCDMASGSSNVVITSKGVPINLCGIAVLTLTAERIDKTFRFTNPVRVDKNTTINWAGTFTAGACIRNLSISGYIEQYGN